MKSKIALALFLVASIAANVIFYLNSTDPKLAASSAPVMIFLDEDVSITASGYLKWNDDKNRPSAIRQFFHIHISGTRKQPKCEMQNIWDQPGRDILISSVEGCKVTSADENKKLFSIAYQDVVFNISENEVTFLSLNKDEAGGGALVAGHKL